MPGHTFRVFVSSTFSDLKAERNTLQQWVFPRLRALCETRGFKFQAVDLRWGVREEAALDQQTVRICLEEIARCQRLSPRPNFIVLLGDRYGWRPPPSTIAADEMEALRPHLTADALTLVFGDPAAPDDTGPVGKHGWYRRDDNAVPAEYVLQPRRGAFETYATWEPVERRLREGLAGAAERVGLGESARRKYRASATELEIMKGAVDAADARDHVFGFFRSIRNLDDVKAALPADAAKELVDTLPDDTWDREASSAQERLKALLRDRLGDANVCLYEATWNRGTGALDVAPAGTTSLCEAVWQRLSRVVVAQMDALDRETRDPLEVEKRAHADFAEGRRRVFVGRQEPRVRIAAYLRAGRPRPLVLHGPSGSGKSALMARAIADARAANPYAVVIERFIGATPGASEIRPLLESLCEEIGRAFGGDQHAMGDYPKLVTELPKRLALATPARPLIVFLDALDQLGETYNGRRLAWLPRELPTGTRIVVSTLEDDKYECLPVLHAGAEDGDFVRLEPLTKDEGREILNEWLGGAPDEAPGERGRSEPSKGMNEGLRLAPRRLTTARAREVGRPEERGQLDLVLARFEKEGSPLYLKLAFEEARRWHSYDGDAPAAALPEDVTRMIRALYRRLSEESQHGAVVTGRALAYLSAARYGLSDGEMLDVLWRDPRVQAELQEHARQHQRQHQGAPERLGALPPVIWSRLFFDLEPYLTERGIFGAPLLSFYHRQLGEVAAEEYLDVALPALRGEGQPSDHGRLVHAALALYFRAVADPDDDESWRGKSAHALSELPYHQTWAEAWGDLVVTLQSLLFLESKVVHGLAFDLPQDFARALHRLPRQAPADAARRSVLRFLDLAIRRDIHFIARHAKDYPQGLFQCLWNSCWWHDCPEAQFHVSPLGPAARPPTVIDPLLSDLMERWRDQRRRMAGDFVWVRSLFPPRDRLGSGLAAKLPSHDSEVVGMAFDASCAQLASVWKDGLLRVWSVDNWAEQLQVRVSPGGPIREIRFSSDGSLVLCATDSSICAVDLQAGLQKVLFRKPDGASAMVISSDASSVLVHRPRRTLPVEVALRLGWRDAEAQTARALHVLDLLTGALLKEIPCSRDLRTCYAVAEDGDRVIVGTDRGIEVWSSDGGVLSCYRPSQGMVALVVATADGRLLATEDDRPNTNECTAVVLDSDTGRVRSTLTGHRNQITSMAFSRDGRYLVTSSWSPSAHLWETASGRCLQVLAGHERPVVCVAIAPTGELVACGGEHGEVRVFSALDSAGATEPPPAIHDAYVSDGFAFDGDRTFVSWDENKIFKTWDVRTGRCLRKEKRAERPAVLDRWFLSSERERRVGTRTGAADLQETGFLAQGHADPIAWFNEPLRHPTTRPDCRLWLASHWEQLFFLNLEGTF